MENRISYLGMSLQLSRDSRYTRRTPVDIDCIFEMDLLFPVFDPVLFDSFYKRLWEDIFPYLCSPDVPGTQANASVFGYESQSRDWRDQTCIAIQKNVHRPPSVYEKGLCIFTLTM
jgi:hypothetical protein